MSSRSSFASFRRRNLRRQTGTSGGDGERGFRKEADGKSRRPSLASVFSKSSRANTETRRLKTSTGNELKDLDSLEGGIKDYRSIPRRMFLAQPMLQPKDKDIMSIGSLYVHVMEARGLMSSDLNGSSDPYVKLCLTGRYLSHRQEWSEKLRLEKQTVVVKRSLDPVWDEEFMLPIRRAGAVLRVEVWDHDLSSADDPLGHFEINIGEELLSQKPMDMWYVLETPRGVSISTAAAKARRRGSFTEDEDHHLAQGRQSLEGDTSGVDSEGGGDEAPRSPPDLISGGDGGEGEGGEDTRGQKFSSAYKQQQQQQPKNKGSTSQNLGFRRGNSGTVLCEDHSHDSEPGARYCKACIDLRRKALGEVRLKLWFQYDEFAEMCSHVWPEEPLRPESAYFSPNQVYRKGMILYEMARPYLNFAREADLIMSWTQPLRSLIWLMVLVGMLLVPYVLIVVVNLALMRIVVKAYQKHRPGDNSHDHDLADDAPSNHPTDAPASTSQSTVNSNLSTSLHAYGGVGRRSSISDGQGLIESPNTSPEHLYGWKRGEEGVEAFSGEVSDGGSMHSSNQNSLRTGQTRLGGSKVSRTLAAVSRIRSGSRHRQPSSSDPIKSSSAPARIMARHTENGQSQRSTLPNTAINSPVVDSEASVPSSGGGGLPLPRNASNNPSSHGSTGRMKGKRMKKIKKLLPTRFTRDPEIDELDKRLGSTKKLPLILNEFGKWVLGKNGPVFQDRVDRSGLMLIKIRERFHPLNAKNLLLMMAVLTAHMLLQLWLYHTGRFNLYFVLGCLAQFSNRFYTQWGKAFVLGLKEAFRSRRLRRALAHVPVLSGPDGAPSWPHPPLASSLASKQPSLNQKHPDFAFAPPGAIPASGPIATLPNEMSFLSVSPNRQRRRATVRAIMGSGRDGSGRSPGGVSPTGGRRASSPRSLVDQDDGNNNEGGSIAGSELEGGRAGANGQRWSWGHPWGRNRGRSFLMEKYPHSSEPALRGGRRGLMESPMDSGGASSTGDDVAMPHERQTTEDTRHVDIGDGSVTPPALPVRPRQRRKSVRARRRVRWGRVVAVLLALGCVIVGMAVALRSVRIGNLLLWFSDVLGYDQGEEAVEVNFWWCSLEAWQWGSLVKLSEDFLFRRLPDLWSSYAWSDARPPATVVEGQ